MEKLSGSGKAIRLNLGNGDLVALGAAIMMTAEDYDWVVVPTVLDKLDNAQALFIDQPQVRLKVVKDMAEVLAWDDALDFYEPEIPKGNTRDHYAWLYHKLGIPYAFRWIGSPIPYARQCVPQIIPPAYPYQLVHDDPERGFFITKGLRKGLSPFRMCRYGVHPLLAWCDVIERAEEVHCMDSVGFHLALHCHPKSDKLFLHRYPRPYTPVWMDYDTGPQAWRIVE